MPTSFDIADSGSVIGLIVALDTQRPTFKAYDGKNVHACTNLSIFNANNVFTQESNIGPVFSRLSDYIDGVDKGLEQYGKIVNTMKLTHYNKMQLREMHGRLLEGALKNPKLGHTIVIQGIKELLDAKSVYHAKGGETTMWNYYNSITEYIKRADVLDRPSKTVMLSELFELHKLQLN